MVKQINCCRFDASCSSGSAAPLTLIQTDRLSRDHFFFFFWACDPDPLKSHLAPWGVGGRRGSRCPKWQTAGRRWHALLAKYSTPCSNSADRENIDTVIPGPPLRSEKLLLPGHIELPVFTGPGVGAYGCYPGKNHLTADLGIFFFRTYTECLHGNPMCFVTFKMDEAMNAVFKSMVHIIVCIDFIEKIRNHLGLIPTNLLSTNVVFIWQHWSTRCNCCPRCFLLSSLNIPAIYSLWWF